jgi:arsenite methyltransferase
MEHEKRALEYDAELAAMQYQVAMCPDLVAQRAQVRAALKLRSGEHVLEIGCGNGLLACEMAGEVGSRGRVDGVDLSSSMIATARDLCAQMPNTGFIAADAVDLPYEDASFDVATSVQCLCFVSDVSAALAEMRRVLKPGGRFVILDTDWDTLVWNSSKPDLMEKVMGNYKSIYADARLPRTLSKLLAAAGLELRTREQFAIVNWKYAADSYSGHQIGFTRAVAGTSFPSAVLDDWERDIHAANDDGTYFFNLNRYIFSGVKPA